MPDRPRSQAGWQKLLDETNPTATPAPVQGQKSSASGVNWTPIVMLAVLLFTIAFLLLTGVVRLG